MFTIVSVNNGSVGNSFAKMADSDGTAHECHGLLYQSSI